MKHLKPEALEQEAKYLRLLVYGEPGSGKTWLGASACLDELTSPVLYVEYKSQIASLRSNPEYVKAMEDGRLVILSLDKYEELNHVYTYLFRGQGSSESFDELFPTFPKTLVVDSLTELQRAEVMRRAVSHRR
jgi:KaiC/GvpD/RAD55 family RecA-like ATPase